MSGNFASIYGLSESSPPASVRKKRARKQVSMQSKSRVSALLDELGGVKVGEDIDKDPQRAGSLEVWKLE